MTNTKNIKNGSLYFNKLRSRVERVLGKVNGTRVWTKHHDAEMQDARTKDLRVAKANEYDSYLGKNNRSKTVSFLPPLPPLPQIGVIG
jgi:hypothetical protein